MAVTAFVDTNMKVSVSLVAGSNSARIFFRPFLERSIPFCSSIIWLVVWLSGNALVVINEVTLRQARLIQGLVTVCGQVNHLGM